MNSGSVNLSIPSLNLLPPGEILGSPSSFSLCAKKSVE
jgi:hypothetical protein